MEPESWGYPPDGEYPSGVYNYRQLFTNISFGVSWSRGFISEIRLTCAAFVGGVCGRCRFFRVDGDGRRLVYESVGPDSRWVPCPDCSGSGRTVGLAARLFAAQPVERVTLTDREPDQISNGDWVWVLWAVQGDLTPVPTSQDRFAVPWELFALIERPEEERSRYPTAARYPTRDLALAALSDAACEYGRIQAGLEKA